MRKPPRTFLLVEAALDDNHVPYLVADPAVPSRRVGVERISPPPAAADLDHFADQFRPRKHVVDATDARHLGHFQAAADAQTLKILNRCQAPDLAEATAKLKLIPPGADPPKEQ